MVVDSYKGSKARQEQDEQELQVILGYKVSLRITWAT